jgi:hypothetical protein
MTPDLKHPITDLDATFAATLPKDLDWAEGRREVVWLW